LKISGGICVDHLFVGAGGQKKLVIARVGEGQGFQNLGLLGVLPGYFFQQPNGLGELLAFQVTTRLL
jgi:hypothetical protein